MNDPEGQPAEEQRRSADGQRLIDFLRDRDAACPHCEYNLRNLQSSRCPECGQALQLSVTLVEPYLKAWISLLVAVCAAAGMGVFWAILIPQKGEPPAEVLLGVLMQIAAIPAALVLVGKRRAFMRLSHGMQWAAAVAGYVWFAVSLGVIFSTM